MDPAPAARSSWGVAIRCFRAPQWARFVLLPAASLGPQALSPGGARRAAGSLLLGSLTAALLLAYGYGLNAIADRSTDRDSRKNPLAGASICPPAASISVGFAALGALTLAAVGGLWPLSAGVVSLAASTVYSVGPRLKGLPIVGTVLNVLIFAPLMLVAPGGERPRALPVLLALFIALILQNQILHERADRQEDAAAGAVTTARWLGDRNSLLAVAVLGVVGVITVLALAPGVAVGVAAASGLVLATMAALVSGDPPAGRRVVHRWASTAAGASLFALGLFA